MSVVVPPNRNDVRVIIEVCVIIISIILLAVGQFHDDKALLMLVVAVAALGI